MTDVLQHGHGERQHAHNAAQDAAGHKAELEELRHKLAKAEASKAKLRQKLVRGGYSAQTKTIGCRCSVGPACRLELVHALMPCAHAFHQLPGCRLCPAL